MAAVKATGRSDWGLELQIDYARKQATSEEILRAIDEALSHMRSGRAGHRRGGRPFVRLLEIARLRASEENEWHVVRLLQDSIDYSEGRILQPELYDRYRLFEEGKLRNHTNTNFLASTLEGLSTFVRVIGNNFLQKNPQATAALLLGNIVETMQDARHLDAPEDLPGQYRIVRGRAETAMWLRTVLDGRLEIHEPGDHSVKRLDLLRELVDSDDGESLVRAAELKRQSHRLRELRRIVDDPQASEADLQIAIEGNVWLFGARYKASLSRRRLIAGDEYDIPLIRADGCLHIVELKRSMSARSIVKKHRGTWSATSEVHDAAAQAINYLVALDENRNAIKDQLDVEVRRAGATVLVGHPGLHPEIPEDELNGVLRTLSAHLGRVEILTYKDFLDGAERALKGYVE